MSSDPYRKNGDTDRARQQSFGGPMQLNRPLLQGLKQPQPLNNIEPTPPNNQGLQAQKQIPQQQPKSPNIGKINLQNVGNPIQVKNQIVS